jgi:DNA polymerase III subunit delta'
VSALLRPLPWQHPLWLQLTAQILAGRLHHALLLTGAEGVGKRHFARALSAFLLCERRTGYACGECGSCQQFLAGTHPDAALVSVDGHLGLCAGVRADQSLSHWTPDKDSRRKDIGIEAVRSLIAHLALSSHRGGARAVVVEPAEKLNGSSVNALLKTLEEPPPGAHFLLVSEQPALLKATLRSRCQRLALARPDAALAEAWLVAEGATDARALLRAANGAPLRALAALRTDRAQIEAQWRESMEKLAQRRESPLTVAADIGKTDAADFLRWLSGWLTEALRESVRSAPAGSAGLARLAPLVAESQRRLEGNAKPELVLEALLIQWWSLRRPRRAPA